MDISVSCVNVWHHSVKPRDGKTMTLGTDMFICISYSCQILICLSARIFRIYLTQIENNSGSVRVNVFATKLLTLSQISIDHRDAF